MPPKKDSDYGIGERADGTIDAFPASELQQRLAEWRAKQEAEAEPDDLSDLDGVEELFEDEPKDEPEGGQAKDAALPFGEMPALAAAAARDRLGYSRGLRGVLLIPDRDQWNAAYDFQNDGILVEGKFAAKSDDDKVQTFLHEIGHRGERVDPETFEAFKAAGLGQLPVFLEMANKTHLEDYERTGKVDGADREAFAESYSRACLGMEMPPEVAEFWRRRFGASLYQKVPTASDAKVSKESVDYAADWGGEETACRRCSMFRWQHDWPEDNRCTLVRGDIDARGHCRRWASALAQDAGPPDERRDEGGKWTNGGGSSGGKLSQWFKGSKIADEKGRPRVVYKAMQGKDPHMSEEGLTHVALRREVAERFSDKGKPVRRVYVKAENPFDYRKDSDRDWLVKEMTKKKNVALFNKQTNEMMNSTGKGNYDYEHTAGDIEGGIDDGAYQVFEIPMVIDLIKRRGHDGIYMAEDNEGGMEPNLAVFSPDQIRPVASFAKDEAVASGCAADEWDASRAAEDEWNESQHPRGQPQNKGEFASSPGGSKEPDAMAGALKEIGEKFGGEHALKGAKSSDKGFIRVFHGTGSQAAEKIMKEGLTAGHGGGGDDWLKEFDPSRANGMEVSTQSEPDRKFQVYVSKRPSVARRFAAYAYQLSQKRGGPTSFPVVFAIDIPREVSKKFMHKDSQFGGFGPTTEYGFEGAIKPEWIVGTLKSADQRSPIAIEPLAKDEAAERFYFVVPVSGGDAADDWNEADHPRGQPENAGEFASVGGAGAAGSAETEKKTEKVTKAAQLFKPSKRSAEEVVATVPGAERAIAALAEKLKTAEPTDGFAEEGGFKEMDGTYTPQRAAVHRKIISEIFNPEAVRRATPKAGDKPVLTVIGGRGGSGKSWLTRQGGPVDTSTSILLDSDAIKAMLPGYENWKAPLYHEEATDVLALCDAIATKLGVNTIHDATLKSEANTERRVEQYKAARYDVNGFYMYASPDVAAERALRRFSRGGKFDGRFVPPEIILKKNVDNEKNFDKLTPEFKRWAIYDNDSPAGPKLVAEGGQ